MHIYYQGTKFIIKDTVLSTETSYCNKNRTFDLIPAASIVYVIEYITEPKSCGQDLFREGFMLSFEKAVRKDDTDIQNLTFSKSGRSVELCLVLGC